jgi:hypothetical protein
MSWIQTHSGKALDLRCPDPRDIDVADIAHALSMICRYNGHTNRHYSVAEHCCHVSDWVNLPGYGRGGALAGLLHDASEAYVGDLTYPMQLAIGSPARAAVQSLHAAVSGAILEHLGLAGWVQLDHPEVKRIDRQILLDERNALMGPPPMAWDVRGDPLGVTIHGWAPERARNEWLSRLTRLTTEA